MPLASTDVRFEGPLPAVAVIRERLQAATGLEVEARSLLGPGEARHHFVFLGDQVEELSVTVRQSEGEAVLRVDEPLDPVTRFPNSLHLVTVGVLADLGGRVPAASGLLPDEDADLDGAGRWRRRRTSDGAGFLNGISLLAALATLVLVACWALVLLL